MCDNISEYVTGSKASKIIGVHQRTLYNWEVAGLIETIRTPGGKRLYNVKKYLCNEEKQNIKINNIEEKEIKIENKYEKRKIIYARVSTISQRNDLERQVKKLQNLYPTHDLITDIGSGINLNRKGLRKIIDLAITGNIEEVIIVHKDRLCRFGYDLIEDLIDKYSNGKIIIIEQEKDKLAKEEMVEDVLQIMNIFVAKMNGMRKYKINTE